MDNKLKYLFSHSHCPTEQQLLDYVQGKLTPTQNRKIELHIASCAMCADTVEGIEAMKNPADLPLIADQINQQISNHQKQKPAVLRPVFRRRFMAVAAMLVFVFASVALLNLYFKTQKHELAHQAQEIDNPKAPISETTYLPDSAKKNKATEQKMSEKQKEKQKEKQTTQTQNNTPPKNTAEEKTQQNETEIYETEEEIAEETPVREEQQEEISAKNNQADQNQAPEDETEQNQPPRDETPSQETDNTKNNHKNESLNEQGQSNTAIAVSKEKRGRKKLFNFRRQKAASRAHQEAQPPAPPAQYAFQAFRAENYPLALQYFEQAARNRPQNERIRLYFGISHYQNQQYQQAIDQFQLMPPTTSPALADSANWYKALALIALDKKQQARPILEKLTQSTLPLSQKAREILKKTE